MISAPYIAGPVSDAARHGEQRGSRALVPIADIEPPAARLSPEEARRRYAAAGRASERGFAQRDGRPVLEDQRRAPADLGFTAQHIAQEVLSDGLYFENYRPALAAYQAADTNFASVRRPPLARFVTWA